MFALFKRIFLTCLAGAFLAAVLYAFGWLVRPNLSETPFAYDAAEVERVEKERSASAGGAEPPVLHRTVDYSEGPDAEWYPKGEPPLLAEWVEAGRLPPVAERVGPEPAVVAGVEGFGRYGGTWYRIASSEMDLNVMDWRLAGGKFMRWSPMGYPLRPHLARSVEASEDNRVYRIELRRGMRWSDGHPFTADDVLYWWEKEVLHFDQRPDWILVRGERPVVTKLDDHTVEFR